MSPGKNWKTTAGGVLSIIVAVASFFGIGHMDPSAATAAIISGLALIGAKDDTSK